jgi:hypothetical protein
MDSELIAVCAVQVIVLAVVVAAIIVYLLRHLMFRSRYDDASSRTVLVTGCDSSLGFDLARHLDRLGFRVLAACTNPAGEGAVRLQAEASARLTILPLDPTSQPSLNQALKTIREQLPTSEKGKSPRWDFLMFSSERPLRKIRRTHRSMQMRRPPPVPLFDCRPPASLFSCDNIQLPRSVSNEL